MYWSYRRTRKEDLVHEPLTPSCDYSGNVYEYTWNNVRYHPRDLPGGSRVIFSPRQQLGVVKAKPTQFTTLHDKWHSREEFDRQKRKKSHIYIIFNNVV